MLRPSEKRQKGQRMWCSNFIKKHTDVACKLGMALRQADSIKWAGFVGDDGKPKKTNGWRKGHWQDFFKELTTMQAQLHQQLLVPGSDSIPKFDEDSFWTQYYDSQEEQKEQKKMEPLAYLQENLDPRTELLHKSPSPPLARASPPALASTCSKRKDRFQTVSTSNNYGDSPEVHFWYIAGELPVQKVKQKLFEMADEVDLDDRNDLMQRCLLYKNTEKGGMSVLHKMLVGNSPTMRKLFAFLVESIKEICGPEKLKEELRYPCQDGNNALCYAIKCRRGAILRYLDKAQMLDKADLRVHIKDASLSDLLLLATKTPEQKDEILELVFQIYADCDCCNEEAFTKRDRVGMTALHHAGKNGYRVVAKHYSNQKIVESNTRDNYGCTPLHYAGWRAHQTAAYARRAREKGSKDSESTQEKANAAVKFIRDAVENLGWDPSSQCKSGWYASWFAMGSHDAEAYLRSKSLVDKGSLPSIQSLPPKHGRTVDMESFIINDITETLSEAARKRVGVTMEKALGTRFWQLQRAAVESIELPGAYHWSRVYPGEMLPDVQRAVKEERDSEVAEAET
jgi:hypothetical protein